MDQPDGTPTPQKWPELLCSLEPTVKCVLFFFLFQTFLISEKNTFHCVGPQTIILSNIALCLKDKRLPKKYVFIFLFVCFPVENKVKIFHSM